MIYAKDILDPIKIGKIYAHASDNEQSAIINSMGAELTVACRNAKSREMQICYISDKLDKNGKALITDLFEFITLRENTKKEESK